MSSGRGPNSGPIYVIGDGDNIRQRIEREIFGGDLNACREVSNAISCAMERIKSVALSADGWDVVFCGGDDILLKVEAAAYSPDFIRQMMDEFSRASRSTICFGAARSLPAAYLNLRRAKTRGNGVLVCESEVADPTSDSHASTADKQIF